MVLVIIFSVTEGREDLVDIVMELKQELSDVKKENVYLKQTVESLKVDIDELESSVTELKSEIEAIQDKASHTERDVSFLKDPPHYHACAFQMGMNHANQTLMPFQKLT